MDSKKLQKEIQVLKALFDKQRRVRSTGKIITPADYETEELTRMIDLIESLECKVRAMK